MAVPSNACMGFERRGKLAMANDVKEIGEIAWVDLTIPGAEKVVREFYQSVIGWEVSEFNMGDYNDYALATPEGQEDGGGYLSRPRRECQPAAALDHLYQGKKPRGKRSRLPRQWR